MTTGVICAPPILQFTLNNGKLASGGSILTQVGGVNAATYQDSGLITPLPNPIPLNSRGEISTAAGASAQLFLTPNTVYTFTLFDGPNGTGNQIWQATYVNGVQISQAIIGSFLYPQTAAEIAAGVTPSNYAYQPYNILRYGADGTGSLDSTAAFAAAGSIGRLIYCPAGTYKVSSGIGITGGGIVGDGAYQTYITTSDTGTSDVFTYTGSLAGRFENFSLQPVTTKSGGNGIVIGPVMGEVSGMRLFELVFNGLPNCIYFKRASLWSMSACNFYAFTGTAVLVDNQNDGDSGDSAIGLCQFTSPGNTGSFAIRQVSSGGLKITTTKFNNVGVGYLLDLGNVAGHVSTSITLIDNCSFETATFSAIQLQRQVGATSTFANFSVVNCEFLVQGASASGIFSNDTSGFLSNVNIGPNVFSVTGTGGATGIQFDYVTNLSIGKQDMQGSGGTSTGILIGTHCTGVSISKQQIRGFQFSINAPVASVTVEKGDIQGGQANVTCSSASGSLFTGTTTVTLPTAYDADISPNVQTDAWAQLTGTAGGGVSASVTAMSATQITLLAVSVTNGGVVPVNWRTAGVF